MNKKLLKSIALGAIGTFGVAACAGSVNEERMEKFDPVENFGNEYKDFAPKKEIVVLIASLSIQNSGNLENIHTLNDKLGKGSTQLKELNKTKTSLGKKKYPSEEETKRLNEIIDQIAYLEKKQVEIKNDLSKLNEKLLNIDNYKPLNEIIKYCQKIQSLEGELLTNKEEKGGNKEKSSDISASESEEETQKTAKKETSKKGNKKKIETPKD